MLNCAPHPPPLCNPFKKLFDLLPTHASIEESLYRTMRLWACGYDEAPYLDYH